MSNKIKKRPDKNVEMICSLLRKHGRLTIADLVRKARSSRGTMKIALARLEENNRVSIERVGMAKIYSLK